MFVCLCKAITEQQICDAIDQGARSMADLRNQLAVATDCGLCACDAKALLARSHSLAPSQAAAQSMPAAQPVPAALYATGQGSAQFYPV